MPLSAMAGSIIEQPETARIAARVNANAERLFFAGFLMLMILFFIILYPPLMPVETVNP